MSNVKIFSPPEAESEALLMKSQSQLYSSPRKLRLPSKLFTLLEKTYPEKATKSTPIIKALEDYFRLERPRAMPEAFGIHQILAEKDLDEQENVSVRIPESMLTHIKHLTQRSKVAEDISQMISLMLGEVLYFRMKNLHNSEFGEITKPLLRVHGNKFNKKMQVAIRQILENADSKPWETSVETCAGGLGIHLNFNIAEKCIINDYDSDKINLYKAIQSSQEELIKILQSYDVNETVFNTIKNNKKNLCTSGIDIVAAAQFLYLNLVSCRNDGSSYNKNASVEKYQDTLQIIYYVHRKLKKTRLLKEDIIRVIEKYIHRERVLFIIDPPYLDSKGYTIRTVANEKEHIENFGWDKHKNLAKAIQRIKKNGNDFIYFCRTTYRDSSLTPEELEEQNRHMAGRIGDLYRNRGFYYVDIMLDKNITERIITSFNFKGANVYGKERL